MVASAAVVLSASLVYSGKKLCPINLGAGFNSYGRFHLYTPTSSSSGAQVCFIDVHFHANGCFPAPHLSLAKHYNISDIFALAPSLAFEHGSHA